MASLGGDGGCRDTFCRTFCVRCSQVGRPVLLTSTATLQVLTMAQAHRRPCHWIRSAYVFAQCRHFGHILKGTRWSYAGVNWHTVSRDPGTEPPWLCLSDDKLNCAASPHGRNSPDRSRSEPLSQPYVRTQAVPPEGTVGCMSLRLWEIELQNKFHRRYGVRAAGSIACRLALV